ncbi:FxsA family protein [Blastococcus sp. CCUG 61487]|uniref:FxsA family protein n=1 Tax=Blastococcus sp. CCUG 61487 TaxID=1840703 RepID=UPI001134CC78|nr:FxsA family protein [Blastococcus sp. CCUG 61487]TKJ33128.1 exlusion protein FxsA [Blastococcus sp. CCUG 61487]
MTAPGVRTTVGRRLRIAAALLAIAEVVVFVLVANWIGVGATILATLATTALGWFLLARQGTRALGELRENARTRRPSGRAIGDAGLVAVGGLLMVLPGFLGDLIGLLCLLPGTRSVVRGALARLISSRLPVGMRPPVRVDSVRTAETPRPDDAARPPLVIEGEVVRGPDGRPLT